MRRRLRQEACEQRPGWETAKWAHAARVAAWIDRRIAPERLGACNVGDTISAWRKGGTTSFWTVDSVLTKLGLHVAQLPEEAWAAGRSG
jgi:hypothetical protein